MKVFILEDDLDRTTFLFKWVRKYIDDKAEIFAATNYNATIQIFEKEKIFDLMLLDHDLQFRFMDSKEPETGYQVAKYIMSHGVIYDQCIIHSINVDGANGMHELLPHSVCVPIFALGFKYDIIKFGKKVLEADGG